MSLPKKREWHCTAPPAVPHQLWNRGGYPCRYGECQAYSEFFANNNTATYGHLCRDHYGSLPVAEKALYHLSHAATLRLRFAKIQS